jgi:hypothetical protein
MPQEVQRDTVHLRTSLANWNTNTLVPVLKKLCNPAIHIIIQCYPPHHPLWRAFSSQWTRFKRLRWLHFWNWLSLVLSNWPHSSVIATRPFSAIFEPFSSRNSFSSPSPSRLMPHSIREADVRIEHNYSAISKLVRLRYSQPKCS